MRKLVVLPWQNLKLKLVAGLTIACTNFALLSGCAMAPRMSANYPNTVPASALAPVSIGDAIGTNDANDASVAKRFALEPLTFSSAASDWINQALARSATVAAAQASLAQADASTTLARGALLPELNANLDTRDIAEREAPGVTLSAARRHSVRRSASVEFRWELDLFGAGKKRFAAQRAQTQASAAELFGARQRVASELQLAMVRGYHAQQRQTLAAAAVAQLKIIEHLEKSLTDSGIKDQTDWLRVRSDLQTRQSELELDQLELQAQRLRLRALSDRPLGEVDQLLASLAPPGNCNVSATQNLSQRALALRPDVLAAQYRLRATLNEADAAQLDRLPSFTLTGSTQTTRTGDALAASLMRSFEHSFGLGLVQRLFASGRISAAANSAAAQAALAGAQYRETLLLAAQELDFALAKAKQSTQTARRSRSALHASIGLRVHSAARRNAGIDSVLTHANVERETLERRLNANDSARDRCESAIALRRAAAQVWPLTEDVATPYLQNTTAAALTQ
jgi:outer membrane protein TolC